MLLLGCTFVYVAARRPFSRLDQETIGAVTESPWELKAGSERQRKKFKIWIFCWFGAVFTSLVVGEGLSHFVEVNEYARFRFLAGQPNRSILLSARRKSIEAIVSTERRQFVAMITDAGDASFGRSHPVELVSMKFENSEESYTLGRDAYHPNGFWLLRDFGAGEVRLCVLKRFYSSSLAEWLRRNRLP